MGNEKYENVFFFVFKKQKKKLKNKKKRIQKQPRSDITVFKGKGDTLNNFYPVCGEYMDKPSSHQSRRTSSGKLGTSVEKTYLTK